MLSPETGKRKSARIALDYFRRDDRLVGGKGTMSVLLAAVTLAWAGGFGFDPREWSRREERMHELANHGPLIKAHDALKSTCDSCHVPFTPIDGSGWTSSLFQTAKASDAKCQACHPNSAHQATEEPGDVASCASCHSDHRGRDASLVAMADRNCIRCHLATDEHMKAGAAPSFANTVERFDGDPSHHPEFALFRSGPLKDPGRLKFNHALHLSPGFTTEAGGRSIRTIADLPTADRETYRMPGQVDSDPVKMRCESCHEPDGDRRIDPGNGTKAGGSYMRPIRFERDCRACHTLGYDPELPEIRHGLQPDQVGEALWQAYAAQGLRNLVLAAEATGTRRPVPGRTERVRAREAIEPKVARAERILFGEKKCGECHVFEAADGKAVPPLTAEARIARPNIPDVWFRHASFDHSSHRTANCRDCHSQAYPDDPASSRTSADVMLPTIANCRSCHASGSATSKTTSNGCVDCHRYHNGKDAGKEVDLLARGHGQGKKNNTHGTTPGTGSGTAPTGLLRWLAGADKDRRP